MFNNAEKLNTPEKETSTYDLVISAVERILKDMPENENKRFYLTENLSKEYGKELAEKIVGSLTDAFLIETKIKLDKTKNINGLRTLATVGKVAVPLAMASVAVALNPFDDIKGETKKVAEKIIPKQETSTTEKNPTEEEKNISLNLRFKGEIYSTLPEGGKEIYKYFAEKNPTPNRGYQFLDKTNATMYIFNSNNEIIAKIPTGFGKEAGDESNTSTEYNKGRMTTPSGIYLMSNSVNKADIEEYGKLQYSLYGVSILGDKIFLGQHQTYSKHGELEPRTEKLNSVQANDNNFSNGCLNNREEDFKKYIQPYFKGDNSELLFVLQDEKSKKSGASFNVDLLVKQIFPLILEMANQEEKTYRESISKIKNIININWEDIANLQNKQNELIIKYNKNKENYSLQDKIHDIKELIKAKKGIIGNNRGELAVYYTKMKDIEIKRRRVEEMLVVNN